MFRVTRNSGFQITFANGWTVSVQWGHGNYCQNQYKGGLMPKDTYAFFEGRCLDYTKSKDAEIAAWDKDGNWHDFGNDTVQGRCSAEQVAVFIAGISQGLGKPSHTQRKTLEEVQKVLAERSET